MDDILKNDMRNIIKKAFGRRFKSYEVTPRGLTIESWDLSKSDDLFLSKLENSLSRKKYPNFILIGRPRFFFSLLSSGPDPPFFYDYYTSVTNFFVIAGRFNSGFKGENPHFYFRNGYEEHASKFAEAYKSRTGIELQLLHSFL